MLSSDTHPYAISLTSLYVHYRFGAFAPRYRPARKARNPKTQEELQVPASTVPYFSASKTFKDKVGQAHNGAEPNTSATG